jgi:hypothetical protein
MNGAMGIATAAALAGSNVVRNSDYSNSRKEKKHLIKHKAITKKGKTWYHCIQAVIPTKEKLVYKWAEVTCKNCLKALRKEMEDELMPYGYGKGAIPYPVEKK